MAHSGLGAVHILRHALGGGGSTKCGGWILKEGYDYIFIEGDSSIITCRDLYLFNK